MGILSTAQAARRLGVSVATLNRWAAAGLVPVAGQGDGRTGPRFYDEADLDALVAERQAS